MINYKINILIKNWFYVLTIILFVGLFFITMVFDNSELNFGFGKKWLEIEFNNKIPLQFEIFIHGLIFVLTCIYTFERVLKNNEFVITFLKILFTLISIYLINYGLFKIIGRPIWCIYYYHHGSPLYLFALTTFVYLFILIGILELIKICSEKIKIFQKFSKVFEKYRKT